MKTLKLHIGGTKANLVDYLVQSIEFKYVDDTEDITILAGEEYRLRTNSNQMFLITIKKGKGYWR